jgi:hypothetical protein
MQLIVRGKYKFPDGKEGMGHCKLTINGVVVTCKDINISLQLRTFVLYLIRTPWGSIHTTAPFKPHIAGWKLVWVEKIATSGRLVSGWSSNIRANK